MNNEFTSYPLAWPVGWQRAAVRTTSRFRRNNRLPSVAWARDFVLLELQRMGTPDYLVVISTNLQLRRDGLPYSAQKEPNDPGAAVYWRVGEKRFVMACDRFTTVGENLYTIGKTIEATRAIERWGAVTTEQAFAGYVALEEKTEASCWEVLQIPAESNRQQILDAWRRRAFETHPDHGGTADAFNAINKAKDIALSMRS